MAQDKTPSSPEVVQASNETETKDAVEEKTVEEGGDTAKTDTVANSTTSSTGAQKRQRTLMEMMSGGAKTSGGAGKDQEQRVAKKQKTTSEPSTNKNDASGSSKTPALGLQPLNSIPFSLAEFKAELTEESRELLQLECETMGLSWLKVLKDEIQKPYFIKLKKFLWSEGVRGPIENPTKLGVYPAPNNIYAWSKTPLGRVRVVIIGQDPYHGPGQAHGLCFSVPKGIVVPPSLRNIYAEIKTEYPGFVPPKHGNLSVWAEDGVLLLNTALTVRAGNAGSHSKKGWEQFTDKVIEVVDRYGGSSLPDQNSGKTGTGRGIVFLAWGAWAAKRVANLDKKKHLILCSAHPSPLSASRGFLGNGHFRKANDWLEKRYGKDGLIDWCKVAD